MKTEMRSHPRFRKTFAATVERVASQLEPGQSRSVRAETLDLSTQGLGLTTDEAFDPGAHVRVTIFLDASQAAQSHGIRFVTEAQIRSCVRGADGRFRLGMRMQERTTRELDAWNDLVARWSARVL